MKQTTNYNMFKIKKGNRIVNMTHVQKIKDSLIKHTFLPSCPIICDKNMNVIDGQHRLQAARELGIAVYYVIEEEPDQDLLIDLNITQRKWSTTDYITYYANEKSNENYKRLLQMIKEIPFDATTLLCLAFNLDVGGNFLNNKLKTGQLELTEKDVRQAHIVYDNILSLRDALRCTLTGRMARAVVSLQRHPKFSWSTMLHKAKQWSAKAYQCSTKQEWENMLIMLYNMSTTKAARI